MNKTIRLFSLLLLLATGAAQADLAIITSPQSGIGKISIEQLQRLYLHKADRFPNAVRLYPIDQHKGTPARTEFLQKVLGMSENQLSQYWSRRMFSGRGKPPRVFDSDARVIEEVLTHVGTVGYVEADSVDDRVRVLLRLP
ncbi:MAG TPA: phosphate ABC transporter substrate-binding protein [Gammaproteobacteria bacterium]|nr:phosphate ABC transporter substrate-binding protein [Gammaproteobacteria bacterium]